MKYKTIDSFFCNEGLDRTTYEFFMWTPSSRVHVWFGVVPVTYYIQKHSINRLIETIWKGDQLAEAQVEWAKILLLYKQV